MQNKNNAIIELRIKTYAFHVCKVAGIPFNPSAMEDFFMPWVYKEKGYRNGKFRNYVNGLRPPSNKTLQEIENKCQGTKELFNSPLWTVLVSGSQTTSYWESFYTSLPMSLKVIIFDLKNDTNSTKRVKITEIKIKKIQKQGNQVALACLIALLREADLNDQLYIYDRLEHAVYNLLLLNLQLSYFNHFYMEIWLYFKKHIIRKDRSWLFKPERFQESEEQLSQILYIDSNAIKSAITLRLVTCSDEISQFYYWLYQGNYESHLKELIYRANNRKWDQEENQSGLNKLIKNINSDRKPANKIKFTF